MESPSHHLRLCLEPQPQQAQSAECRGSEALMLRREHLHGGNFNRNVRKCQKG